MSSLLRSAPPSTTAGSCCTTVSRTRQLVSLASETMTGAIDVATSLIPSAPDVDADVEKEPMTARRTGASLSLSSFVAVGTMVLVITPFGMCGSALSSTDARQLRTCSEASSARRTATSSASLRASSLATQRATVSRLNTAAPLISGAGSLHIVRNRPRPTRAASFCGHTWHSAPTLSASMKRTRHAVSLPSVFIRPITCVTPLSLSTGHMAIAALTVCRRTPSDGSLQNLLKLPMNSPTASASAAVTLPPSATHAARRTMTSPSSHSFPKTVFRSRRVATGATAYGPAMRPHALQRLGAWSLPARRLMRFITAVCASTEPPAGLNAALASALIELIASSRTVISSRVQRVSSGPSSVSMCAMPPTSASMSPKRCAMARSTLSSSSR
mmetsp:Transcript_46253/g.142665  ORF Transcript_46253/g.142665 Transcript_46253/m.142665 type:complete len:387 (+) Transcript_46253:506-1666(+)